MMRTIVAFLCIWLVSAGGSRPTPGELIERFKSALPGAFPQGLTDNIDSASNLVKDVTKDLSGGNTELTKEELEEAKRILKLTVVANIVQKKQEQDELLDEEEFLKTSEKEIADSEKEVETFVENLLKSGVVRIVERDPLKESEAYKEIMLEQKEAEEARKTSGLVGKSHKNEMRTEDEDEDKGTNLVELFGLENMHKLYEVEKRPDLLPGGKSFLANQARRKVRREQKAMARRWRSDPRPIGRLTSGDVLDNKDRIVDEIFKAYDHDNDNTLNLAEFNELQTDTDGPDSVNTKEEYADLLKQVGSKTEDSLHFLTFKHLYLDPWMSEKFETVLPVDYHALLEAGKLKGEALAETWAEQDFEREAIKEAAPIFKEDDEEAKKRMQEMEAAEKKQ